jgi:hypothetical protein
MPMLALAAQYVLFVYVTGANLGNAPAIDTHLTFKTLNDCIFVKQQMDAALQQNTTMGWTRCIQLHTGA